MKIIRILVGSLGTNGYLIYDEKSMKGYVIDPEEKPDIFIDYIEKLSVKIMGIILTHHHYDHRGAVKSLQSHYSCKLYIHEEDQKLLPIQADILLKDKDIIHIGEEELQVINTPGHTRGGICLMSPKDKIAITGDTLFSLEIGRTDLEDGSPQQMMETMQNIISKWDDDIAIYPGHGEPSTMAQVRQNNKEYLYAISLTDN